MARDMAPMEGVSETLFRRTLGAFCTGVVVVTGWDEGGAPLGFTAQSLVSLSLNPPLIGISPSKQSRTWARIRRAGRFAVNILSEGQADISSRFASAVENRFEGQAWEAGPRGPILPGILGYVDCELAAEHEVGDHTLAVGRVVATYLAEPAGRPLLYFRGAHELLASAS